MVKKNRKNKYLKILDLIQNQIRIQRIRMYSSKFSKRIFNNKQHIVLQVFRQLWRNTYREFLQMLMFSKLPQLLNLNKLPHFTTLQKFAKRTSSTLIGRLITSICKMLSPVPLQIGIDGTGFSLERASHYYCKRIDRTKPVKGFVKLNASSDLKSNLILSVRVRKHPSHETKDFIPLLKKITKRVSLVCADKAYDSEKNHEFVRHKLLAESVIPLRIRQRKRLYGMYRKLLSKQFPEKLYGKRSNAESTFGALKRRFGSTLTSRTFRTQKTELMFRILAYNANRFIELTAHALQFWRAFLQSPI